jgi:hypothetical protein
MARSCRHVEKLILFVLHDVASISSFFFGIFLLGAVGKDGSLYFIPENGYRVMRVTPPQQPPKIVDGKLPEDDVLIELM